MLAIVEGLDEEAWNGLQVPHKYMGPLPSCFYPVAQLVGHGPGDGQAVREHAVDRLVEARP